MNRFEGTVVVVTGGSKGIGNVLATSFFKQGAKVAICGRNKNEVETACKDMDPTGVSVIGFVVDVTSNEECTLFIENVIKIFGSVDVLVNNAGTIGEANLFENAHIDSFINTVTTNLFGTVSCTHAVISRMKANGRGKIINFAGAGVGSKKTLSNFSAYYTSKGAVVSFTETVANELLDSNIQINCISPGAINTNITDFVIKEGREKVGDDMYERTLKQKNEGGDSVENVVAMVHYLASSESDHVTGRLLSAKWDTPDTLLDLKKGGDLFTLRRIDNQLFYGKE